MGKSKKKTTITKDTTVTTKVVKLSYLQTLSMTQGYGDVSKLETEGGKENLGSSSSKKAPFWGAFGSKKVSTSVTEKTSGEKIIDQWLQPYFDKIRYAIGIKEISAAAYTFAEASEFTSTPFGSPKEIIKVYCIVDEYIPAQFDQSIPWIKYFIKIEGTDEWIRLNPFSAPTQFDELGEIIPKIINFNLPKPPSAKLEDKYQTTDSPVMQIRFKALLSRPLDGDNISITPLLKSYRLIFVPKELL